MTFTQLHGNRRCSSRNNSGCANTVVTSNFNVIAGIVCQLIWNANQFFTLFINEIMLLPVFNNYILAKQYAELRDIVFENVFTSLKWPSTLRIPIVMATGINSFVTYCFFCTGHGRGDKREITTKLLFVNK